MSKHKNKSTRKERKEWFAASCLSAYRSNFNLGAKKRYNRLARKNRQVSVSQPVADDATVKS
jgi:hypothetical protein